MFTNKLKCSKCGSFLGGKATKKKSGKKYYYYKCEHCNVYFTEDIIEDKKIRMDNKLRIGIITLDVSEIKKVCTSKAYDFIMNACEEYKKDFKNFISRIAI